MALKSSMKLRARAFFSVRTRVRIRCTPLNPGQNLVSPPLNPAQNLEHPQENTPFPSGYQCTLP